ncbi:DNA polymerase II [Marinomonas sp. SBI22]|uniref:DNA polymerase II n=1 Tax=unclassified Marinomonas TaxID=196814 RepID=UPI0007AF70C6|nr:MULTISPECIES: DNA polymerase II [unclassified Marinomonas]KZM44951.1 DNA polymerase II [Marinomonas sp. SBI22]KZM46650.1 DNA polymerase II [Marinomonas sp. SBI8L]
MSELTEINGYILTRQSKDVANKIETAFWVKTDAVCLKVIPEKQQCIFFVSVLALPLLEGLPCIKIIQKSYLSFSEEPLYLISCESLLVQSQVTLLLEKNGFPYYEHDVRPEDRYIMERGIKGKVKMLGYLSEDKKTLTQARLLPSRYEPNWLIWSLDIETSVSRNCILSIAIVCEEYEACFIVSDRSFDDERVFPCSDEKTLLLEFMRFQKQYSPDIIIGWNLVGFDLNFIDQRCHFYGLKPGFGVDGQNWNMRGKEGSSRRFIRIPGRAVLDGIDLLKVAGYHFDSYSLENVSREILDDGKLIHGSQRWQEIERLHQEDQESFIEYNLQDCRLVLGIFKKLNLIELQQTRVDLTGIPFSQTGGSVQAFENQYLPLLHQQGRAAPNYSKDPFIASPGGFVMSSVPGLYKNVLVFDFKSLYPSIIRTFLVDPLARVKQSGERVEGFLGASYSKDAPILPNLISELSSAREEAKATDNDILSYAIKIIMNSFYGVLGSNLCRFYHPELASSITMRGHEILNQTRKWFEQANAKVIYGDTDSLFITFDNENLSSTEVKFKGDVLCKEINQKWVLFCRENYQIDCYLELEFERTYERFFMPTIRGQVEGSKKRYAGLANDELIFKGLEAVRSDWTPFARYFQKALFKRIFNDESPVSFVKQVVEELYQGKYDNQLVYQKRLSRPLCEYTKVTPPHVRAAKIADQRRIQLGVKPEFSLGRQSVQYYYSVQGVQPFAEEGDLDNIDYDHYLEKQIEPIADSVLSLFGTDLASLTTPQLGLL